MPVRRTKKKSKADKKAPLPVKAEPRVQPSPEQERAALIDSAGVLLLSQLIPLKLEISDDKKSLCLSSFLLSARIRNDKKSFSFEITESEMKGSDLVLLFKTVYKYYCDRLNA